MTRLLWGGIGLTSLAIAFSLFWPRGQVRGPERLATLPAGGTVTYQGQAVVNATVSLQRVDGKVAALGVTDPAGHFRLSTYRENDGAPPGKYRVTVAATQVPLLDPETPAPEPPIGFASAVPLHLASPNTSPLHVEVTPDGPNHFGFHLR